MPLDPNIPLQAGGRRSSLSQDLVTGMQLKGAQQQMRLQEQQLAQAEKARKLEQMAGMAQGVLSAPAEQRAQVYDSMLPQMAEMGLDTSRLPTRYTPEVESSLTSLRDQALPLLERIKMGREDEQQQYSRQRDAVQDARTAPATRDRYTEDGLVIQEEFIPGVGFREYGRGPRSTTPEGLVEVADPNSPTGTRMLPRSQASGMPGKPASGMSFEVGSDGSVRMTQGRGGEMHTSTVKDVEDRVLQNSRMLSQVRAVRNRSKPEYQTAPFKARMAALSTKAKINPGALNPEEQQELQDYAAYRAEAGQFFADRLKAMSGGAVTPQESQRQEAYLPVPGDDGFLGIMSGDDAVSFESKARRMEQFILSANAREVYALRNGLDKYSIPLDQIPQIIDERGAELEAQLRGQVPDEMLEREVDKALMLEFGLDVY